VFAEALGVTGVVLTKLDGTARGGVVIAVQREVGAPVRFVGVGEAQEDLRPFDAREFVEALFEGRRPSGAEQTLTRDAARN
jgi:fused signal recognition particle receptor